MDGDSNQNIPEQIIKDKRLLALYRYWQSKRGARTMPARADIDPAEIPALLPLIVLIDVLGAGEFRYRLLGTEFASNFGLEVTGKTFAEALPSGSYAAFITGLVSEVVSTGRPLYSEGAFMAEKRIDRQVRRLVMPLSADGHTVDMLLGGQTIIDTTQDTSGKIFSANAPFSEEDRHFLA